MKHLPKLRIVLVGIVLFASIGAIHNVLANRLLSPPSESVVHAATPADEPQASGVVASASTPVIEAPEGVEVAVTPTTPPAQPAKPVPGNAPKPVAGQPRPAAEPIPVPPPPAPTPQPIPETIIVNLKTPLFYTLRPGERSPVLEHLMIDGKRYEWLSGQASFWQNEIPDPTLPVWATIQVNAPTVPYISDRIAFTVEAAADAAPGQYTTKIRIVLKDGVILGVPVEVTVTDGA
jgi:hypothetical protein